MIKYRDIEYLFERIDAHFREDLNPYLAPFRRLFLKNKSFTIISNNCWGGHVYRYYNLPYQSPTVGMYIYTADYLKFVKNLRHYIDCEPEFITHEQSKWKKEREDKGKEGMVNVTCPVARLDDIEVQFLHCKTDEEARIKWNRRKSRIDWNHLYFKLSEQNCCTEVHLKEFDALPLKNKFVFVHKDYGLESQIIFKDYKDSYEVRNDTFRFRKFINVTRFLNGKPFKKRQ